jgi:flagellar motor protein MotB
MIKRQDVIIGALVVILNISGAGAEKVSVSAEKGMEWQFLTGGTGLSSNFVYCIGVNEEKKYIGTDKGLNIFNNQSRKVTVFSRKEGLPDERILSLLCDDRQTWIGTARGLALLKHGKIEIIDAGGVLQGLKIKTIIKKDQDVFVGTNKGLFQYCPRTRAVTSLAAIKGRDISGVRRNQQGFLINLSNGEAVNYNLGTAEVEKIKLEYNPLGHKVKAIGSSGDYFWFATDGSGLLGYNKIKKEWNTYSQERGVDRFLSVLAEDGKKIWFGTFYGLFGYDYLEKEWFSVKHKIFAEYDISALAVEGEYLWVGTAGGGVIYGRKQSPYIRTFLPERYFMDEKAVIKGIVRGKGKLTTKIEYCNAVFPDIWLTRNASITNSGHQFQAGIDFAKLPDDIYQFKITVWDADRNFNQELFTLVKQTAPLELTVNLNILRTGRNIIEGEYENQTIEKIILEPGGEEAVLNRNGRTFSGEVNLSLEDVRILAEAFDISGRSKVFAYKIKVNPPPQLNITARNTAFNPGFEEVNFTVKHKFIWEVDYWELSIFSEDEILLRKYTASHDLPEVLTWDGQDESGEMVEGGRLWYYTLKVKEKDGYEIMTPRQAVRSNVLVEKQKRGVVIKLSNNILFDLGRSDIKKQYLYLFEEVSKIIKQYPGSMILIEGHTDSLAIKTYQYPANQQLSEARALTVAHYLIRKFGFEEKRITPIGYGASRPLASNATDAGRSKNRRVEIIILEK